MKEIQHNIEVAKPGFLFFIKNMNPELSKWIQYTGAKVDGTRIFFLFKSSQNSLRFSVYAGVNINNKIKMINGASNEIYDAFRTIKYENICTK